MHDPLDDIIDSVIVDIKYGNCKYCNELFEKKLGKLYCSRFCKTKDKDKRRTKKMHELGIITPIEELRKKESYTFNPTMLYRQYERTKLRARNRYALQTYGLTLEEVNKLKENTKVCIICKTTTPQGRDKKFVIDHCHETKKIRGVICNNCNQGLGFLKHDIEVLKNAIIYLEKFYRG